MLDRSRRKLTYVGWNCDGHLTELQHTLEEIAIGVGWNYDRRRTKLRHMSNGTMTNGMEL
jgi:hypothetical protein